jgi:hypothetical protein
MVLKKEGDKKKMLKKKGEDKKILKKGVSKKKIGRNEGKKIIENKGIKKKFAESKKKDKNNNFVKKEKKHVVKKNVEIKTKGINDFLKHLGKKDYFEIYKTINFWNENYFKKGFSRTFKNKKEMRSFFKERVLDFLKSLYTELKSEISHLRKKGEEVDYIDFEVLQIPQKIKLFTVYFSLEEFLKIKKIVNFSKSEIKKFKVEE